MKGQRLHTVGDPTGFSASLWFSRDAPLQWRTWPHQIAYPSAPKVRSICGTPLV
jgi:hypothetical protein